MNEEHLILSFSTFSELNSLNVDKVEKQAFIKKLLKKYHPDINKSPLANDITSHILSIQNIDKIYKKCFDESGLFEYDYKEILFKENKDFILKSKENFSILRKLSDDHFEKYLPKVLFNSKENVLKVETFENKDFLPLSDLKTPIEERHSVWILSRILEFCIFLNNEGYCHLGFSKNNIFVVPETHGIKIVSFYHLTKEGDRVTTLNNVVKHIYPSYLFKEKTASFKIDLELAKGLIIELLGDPSGNGSSLRGKIKKEYLDFLISPISSINSFEYYRKFRDMVNKNFTKEFLELEYK